MQKGKLIIFSAPSGSGKTTIIKHLLDLDLGLAFSISATSRAIRGTETDGKDYYFLSVEDFRSKIEGNEFLEYEEVYPGNYYGTLKKEVERLRNEGKHVVFDVDVVGGCNIKKFYGNDALSVFIQPPSIEELESRLKNRSTDSEETIAKRVAKAAYELSFASKFDVVLINDKLEEALSKAENIVREFISE